MRGKRNTRECVAGSGVYALRDPRDGSIRYVGASIRLPARIVAIGSSPWLSGRAVFLWLSELRQMGLRASVVVLDCNPLREHHHIVRLLARGEPLLNVMPGNGATAAQRRTWRSRREGAFAA